MKKEEEGSTEAGKAGSGSTGRGVEDGMRKDYTAHERQGECKPPPRGSRHA